MKTSNYQVCSKTVMDTSDPSITFDNNGISNHFWDFDRIISQKFNNGDDNNEALYKITDTIKKEGRNQEFDCILGLSGGLDSSYMLHSVCNLGLRPLVFHVDAGWNTERAVSNINKLVEKLNLELYTEVINWEEVRQFQLAMFKSGVPHLDIVQDIAFISVLYKFAKKHNIKYILNGGNISTECVMIPIKYLYWPVDNFQIQDILKKFCHNKLTTYPFTNIFYHKIYLPYVKKVRVVKPLNFLKYLKKSAELELADKYNWEPFKQKHFESRFTKFFEGYWLFNRFGYDMRRNQFSSLILTGQMTREEASKLLEKQPLTESEISKELTFISKKLGITEEELNTYFRMPQKFYYDYKNIKWLFDIGETVLSSLKITRRGGAY